MTESSPADAGSILGPREPDREQLCDKHGPFVSRNVYRSIWTKCQACEAEATAEREAHEERQRTERRQQRMAELMQASAIPARFFGRTFAGFNAPTPAHQRALALCRDYADGFPDHARRGAGLILAGLPGTGKSHLVAAILQALIGRHDVRYTTCMDMIRAVRDTWRRDSERTETQVLGMLQRLDLLAIDEVGMQYGTEGEQTILFDVLDRRYREVRPTIILTNQDQKGLRDFVGDRTFDRLSETCRWVPFDWPSYRPQARKEAAA